MATLSPKTLYIGDTTDANVYSVGSNVGDYTILRHINICNANTTTDKTITVHLIAPSGSAADNNKYLSSFPVKANDSIQIDTGLVLSNGYSVYISHTGNVTTTITGVEYLV